MIIIGHKLLKNTKITAITLFPFIILKKAADRSNPVLINHEKIHLRQQAELLVIFFYLWYLVEYYYWLYRLRDSFMAYKYISFEREAYAMEDDPDYLQTRKFWNFLKYRAWAVRIGEIERFVYICGWQTIPNEQENDKRSTGRL